MAKEYISGASARKKLGCDKDFFLNLINTGAIEAKRSENGSWKVSNESLNLYLASQPTDIVTKLKTENKFLKDQLDYYKKKLREIKRILPENI